MDLLHRLVVLNLLVGYLSACSSGQFASSEKVDRRDDRLAIDAGNRPQNVPQGGVNTNYWPSRGQGDSEFPEMNQGNRGQSPDPISQGTERPQQPGGTPTETEPTPPSGGGSPSPPAPPPSPHRGPRRRQAQ